MTELERTLAIVSVALPAATGLAVQAIASRRAIHLVARLAGLATGAVAVSLAVLALVRSGHPVTGRLILVDPAGGLFLGVIAIVGTLSVLVSPVYLDAAPKSFFRARSRRWYYLSLFSFWAALTAVPLVGSLGVAWLLVEATTVASALLVAFSGKRSALEAGWKYLVLTTLGLTVTALGVVMLFVASLPHHGLLSVLNWNRLAGEAAHMPHRTALVAFLLVVAGLATKIGWAPVHNWLPDAHSEAPPPVSALLSGALLPAVILVAWRTEAALGGVVGRGGSRAVFLGFGLASLAVAVPFLWRPLAWKRLLAYSSLEHMGVIALGIGFAQPLAIAGVVLHVAGHALAKSLGFYAAIPLFRVQPGAETRPALAVARSSPRVAGALGLALGSLSGLPPSPLFFSEVFVLAGGVISGHVAVAAVAGVLLALGFLGLAGSLIEGVTGRPRSAAARADEGGRWIVALSVAVAVALVALSVAAYVLPHSDPVEALVRWAA